MVTAHEQVPNESATALTDFLRLLPPIFALAFGARVVELATGWPTNLNGLQSARFCLDVLVIDALAVARHLPLLFALLLPALATRDLHRKIRAACLIFAVLLVARALLAQYRLKAGVLLGADLFAYSWADILQTAGTTRPNGYLLVPPLVILAAATPWIRRQLQRSARPATKTAVAAISLACVLAWAAAAGNWLTGTEESNEYQAGLKRNVLAFFIEDSLAKTTARLLPTRDPQLATMNVLGFKPVDANHPFLHVESAPDILGPLLELPTTAPDIVILIVEGLGRSFSGPAARLGSFTPNLDALAAEGLYWDNFLAPQGRTFAVLPTILGSLPFGDQGFLEFGAPLPAHQNLPLLLKTLGYRTRYFSGFDASFDNQRTYLEQTHFDRIMDRGRIRTTKAIANEWGFDDDVLLQTALSVAGDERSGNPSLDVIQTISMHSPFSVPDQDIWLTRLEKRFLELGIKEGDPKADGDRRRILSTVMFTDDALGRYFNTVRMDPAYAKTIFIVTGDHRLPEIPMEDRLERYHVPLIIWSPLLKNPGRIKAVSSQFDILPSLAALLSTHYGLQRPLQSTWLGDGLDTSPAFRNVHRIPLKQTKSELSDFVSSDVYLGQGNAYQLKDGMRLAGSADRESHDRLVVQFDSFRAANAAFARNGTLDARQPQNTPTQRPASAEKATRSTQLVVTDSQIKTASGSLSTVVEFTLSNLGEMTAVQAAPLAVLIDSTGKEHGEAYGQAVTLGPKEKLALQLPIDISREPAGKYFLAVYPSDPETGKRIGDGQFRIPLEVPR